MKYFVSKSYAYVEARQGLDKLSAEAEHILDDAFLLRDSDPQQYRAKVKAVMELATPGSELYARAKRALDYKGESP